MQAILQSLGRTLLAGFVLLALLVAISAVVTGSVPATTHAWWAFAFRWLHVTSATMWVGLLYYFNFVQIPAMPRIPDEHKPAIGRVIAPLALFWFRWAAVATVLTGAVLATMNGYLIAALSLQAGVHAIGIGMWLGLVMAANVWFIIWPCQKIALGIVDASAEQRAAAARRAMLASRINTMLSVPMLYCMVAQQNAGL